MYKVIRNHEIKIRKGCRWHRKFITEEHITVITEPGSNFLIHTTFESSDPAGIFHSIVDYYAYYKINLDLDKLLGIGCCFSRG